MRLNIDTMRPTRLVVLCCLGLLVALQQAEAAYPAPRGRMPLPPAYVGSYAGASSEYDDAYDDSQEYGYDDQYAQQDQYNALPARRQRLESMRVPRRDAMIESQAQVQQPAGIDRDENGVVGDFDGEPGNVEVVSEEEEEANEAQLMAPDGSVVGGEGGEDGDDAEGAAPAAPAEPEGPPPSKLELALGAIKEDIMRKSRQVGEEMTWIGEVAKITHDYKEKSKRVEKNVEVLRGDVKSLYKKKKQIENLILQKELQAKLSDANEDLGTLEKALGHVKTKEEEFVKTRTNIQDTIDGITGQLSKLEGKTDEAIDNEDEESEIEEDIKSEM